MNHCNMLGGSAMHRHAFKKRISFFFSVCVENTIAAS